MTVHVSRPARLATALASASLLTLALGGFGGHPNDNGVAGETPAQALVQSVSALRGVHSLALAGRVNTGGGLLVLKVQTNVAMHSSDGYVTIRRGSRTEGPMQFVDLPTAYYFRAPTNFWASFGNLTRPEIAALADRWITIPPADVPTVSNDLGGVADPAKLSASLLSSGGGLIARAPTTLHGVPVLPIATASSETIYVRRVGEPLPIAVIGTTKEGTGVVTSSLGFSYPRVVHIAPPAGAEGLNQAEQSAG